MREVDHPAVRVLYDQANLTFTHDEPYEEALRIQGDLIGHVHVKDLVFTDPDAPFQASETARVAASERAVRSRVVGDGVVPWAGILSALSAPRLRRRAQLEYEYRWHPQDLPEPEVGFARIRGRAPRLPRRARPPRRARDERAGQDPRRRHRRGKHRRHRAAADTGQAGRRGAGGTGVPPPGPRAT